MAIITMQITTTTIASILPVGSLALSQSRLIATLTCIPARNSEKKNTPIFCAGYHYDLYDEDEEGLKFNPYTSTYDDGYGDLYFDDVEQEVATCRLGEDGQPKFNGEASEIADFIYLV